MTYDAERARLGRKPVLLVEVDLDKCALAYGTGTCQAGVEDSGTAQAGASGQTTLATTASAVDDAYNGMNLEITGGTGAGQEAAITDYNGTTKVATHAAFGVTPDNTSTYLVKDPDSASACYNTRQTCQDKANFDNSSTLTVKLSNTYVPGQEYFHCIERADLAPTIIDPSKGLGIRASIKITIADFPHHDRGIDPYVANRTYTPADQGTFFSKLVARNRHYIGRAMRVKTGYIDESGIVFFKIRNYVIDNIEGPDANGRYTITAKDILKLADDDRVVAPAHTTGTLDSSITAGASSLTVTSGTESEYAGEEYIRIGDEIILAPTANRSANVFSNLSRNQFGTEASAHDAGDQVQVCLELSSTNVVDFVRTLLTTHAGIDSSYITTADWDAERDLWYSGTTLNTLITKPEGIASLINDLARQFFFQVWWDEVAQKILFRPIVPPAADTTINAYDDDNHFVADSVKAKRDDRRRLTRVLFYYNPITPIETDDPEDYKSAYIRIFTDEESADEYGDIRQTVIMGRFVDSESIAVQTAGRMLSRYVRSPRDLEFIVDAKDADLDTGDLIDVNSRRVQGADGANELTRFQVLSVKEETRPMSGHRYRYTALEVNFKSRYGYIGPDSLNDYDAESDANKAQYGFIAPDTAIFDDGEDAYRII